MTRKQLIRALEKAQKEWTKEVRAEEKQSLLALKEMKRAIEAGDWDVALDCFNQTDHLGLEYHIPMGVMYELEALRDKE